MDSNTTEMPKEMEKWVEEQFIAIENKTLPKELAMKFISVVESDKRGVFAKIFNKLLEKGLVKVK